MTVGLAIGIVGGRLILWTMRHIPLPSEGLYAIRTLASALLLYGVAAVAHGSGFLAVFTAGIVLGGENAPYKREIERFHSALASLAEIVAFVVLGLTLDPGELSSANAWGPGLVLGALLLLVIRPVVVGLCLLPARMRPNERAFVLFAGLKGAVPILLGSFLLGSGVPDAGRYYAVVVVVVAFSVVVQGTLTPTVARALDVPMRTVEPEPWALGVRLRDEATGVHHVVVRAGSAADGQALADLSLAEGAWVSLVVRRGVLVAVHRDTRLEPGDEVMVLADPALRDDIDSTFTRPLAVP